MSEAIITIDTPAALAPVPHRTPAPVLAYLARLRSEASRRAMRSKLDQAARILSVGRADALAYPWHVLTPAHAGALASALVSDRARPDGGPYAARTVNATMAAVRGVLRECWRSGLIDADQLARLCDHAPERVTGDPAGRGLEVGELAAIMAAAAADRLPLRGARDAALVGLLYGAGLRAGEAVGLDLVDAELIGDGAAVAVRRGKGRKARAVPLPAGAADALAAWVELARLVEGPLLRAIRAGDRMGGRMSTRGVGRACARLAAAAGVADFKPHDCRRSYIGHLLDTGADLATVQALAGHADPATTARYDRRPAETRRRAARALAVPYRRRGAA